MRFASLLLLVIFTTGCSTMHPRLGKPSNDGWVVVGKNENVEVHAFQSYIINQHDLKLARWDIRYINGNDEGKCVGVDWRTMDFESTNSVPHTWVYVPSHQLVYVGRFVQQPWTFESTKFVLPDAKISIAEIKTKKSTNTGCVSGVKQ